MSIAVEVTTADRTSEFLEALDIARLRIARRGDVQRRAELGQFLTPAPVAQQLAAMFQPLTGCVRILDPGAGIGVLGATLIACLIAQDEPPDEITLTVYEIDANLLGALEQTLDDLAGICDGAGIRFAAELRLEDFLSAAVRMVDGSLFAQPTAFYDAAILNPPYRKIGVRSPEREQCRKLGLETSNLYTAFLAASAALLSSDAQLVAIVPRSFANGTYFAPFRQWFTGRLVFERLHVFESRSRPFADDAVLQENVIFHARRTRKSPEVVRITSSADPSDLLPSQRDVAYHDFIRPDDPTRVIHIVPDVANQRIAARVASLAATLDDLGLTVSTGRVVDFRAREYLRQDPGNDTAPLIYPGHLRAGRVSWPMQPGKKPNGLLRADGSLGLLVPEGLYVLTKRFSSKEEKRRIVAALYDPLDVAPGAVAIENHLNYFHQDGHGLSRPLALGLRAYLNSSLADLYFRQFSGHTQVNAGDLRRIRYPSQEQLCRLGERVGETVVNQTNLDRIINEELFAVTGDDHDDPVKIGRRVEEAVTMLRALGLPKAQLNERSGLTLLALLDLGPEQPWAQASNPMRGITPMMAHFQERYGKTYAPNTRETVRRQTVHQFEEAGLVLRNPDKPDRPPNSPKAVYQIESSALALIRTYGMVNWRRDLDTYLESRETLKAKYAAERQMSRIPLTLPGGREFSLSGGGQNILIAHIIHDFCARWTPGGTVLYVGDADDKFAHYDAEGFAALGISIEEHGKIPDVVVHDTTHDWLVLVEAVTSSRPGGWQAS